MGCWSGSTTNWLPLLTTTNWLRARFSTGCGLEMWMPIFPAAKQSEGEQLGFLAGNHASAWELGYNLQQSRIVTSEPQSERFRRCQQFGAVICLLLKFTAEIGEATHIHLKAEASNSPIRCSICVAAHSAKPAPTCQPIHSVTIFSAFAVLQSPIV